MATADPLTSLPVHASTLRLLQQVKTGAQNWDEFLLYLAEDLITPSLRARLERPVVESEVRPFTTTYRKDLELRRRGR